MASHKEDTLQGVFGSLSRSFDSLGETLTREIIQKGEILFTLYKQVLLNSMATDMQNIDSFIQKFIKVLFGGYFADNLHIFCLSYTEQILEFTP